MRVLSFIELQAISVTKETKVNEFVSKIITSFSVVIFFDQGYRKKYDLIDNGQQLITVTILLHQAAIQDHGNDCDYIENHRDVPKSETSVYSTEITVVTCSINLSYPFSIALRHYSEP